ncbi:LOW QUALITY PROTEIN: CCNB1IP1 isoform 12, partial [Pongo abelii]
MFAFLNVVVTLASQLLLTFSFWRPHYPIMSLCEDMLLCNYRKCRIKLSGYAWVTACSHIFCDQHG